MSKQITDSILMVRPAGFRMNEETAKNNFFQQHLSGHTPEQIIISAQQEFDHFVEKLRANGIKVIVINDLIENDTPDALFPNNWISFHENGKVVLYPMFAENRRRERRLDIIDTLEQGHHFTVNDIIDLSEYENKGIFLEGTGSMILDRVNRIAYAAISGRTHPDALINFCQKLDYEPVVFHSFQSVGEHRLPIYHTNVMMCVAENYAIICLDSIDDTQDRQRVLSKLESTGKEIIEISETQTNQFAGNMLQIANLEGKKFLIMSTSAYKSLHEDQISKLLKFNPIIDSQLEIIETLGGGSARCMIAEIFLPSDIL